MENLVPSKHELSAYTCVASLNMIFQAPLASGMSDRHFLFLLRSPVFCAPSPLDLDREHLQGRLSL